LWLVDSLEVDQNKQAVDQLSRLWRLPWMGFWKNKKQQYKEKFCKIGAKTSLNFEILYLRLLRQREVKKVSNDSSGINFHYSGSH
jgi:hypothetical protein